MFSDISPNIDWNKKSHKLFFIVACLFVFCVFLSLTCADFYKITFLIGIITIVLGITVMIHLLEYIVIKHQ